MNLKLIYDEQYLLMQKMGWPGGKPGSQEAAKGHLLAAIVECTEALNEINWKPWKNSKQSVDRMAYATELMDIIQFVINAAMAMNISPVTLEHALRNKWKVNHERIDRGETTNGSKKESS